MRKAAHALFKRFLLDIALQTIKARFYGQYARNIIKNSKSFSEYFVKLPFL
jgi:hypothetical protein